MADDRKVFSIAEEGCLRVSSHIRRIVYHRSLNVLLVFSSNGPRDTEIKVVVLDIASGTVLHDTKVSLAHSSLPGLNSQGEVVFDDELLENELDGVSFQTFKDPLKCLSVAERGTMIVAHNGLLGVRKDFGRALLLESILLPPVICEEDVVHIELPHNEAMLLRECLQTMDLGQTDPELGNMQTQVINLLTKHMKQYLFNVSKGSRMSSNWCIVNLELPLKTLKAVCTYAVLELKKNNRSIPALPIASSIVVRLAALQQQSNQPQLPQPSSSSSSTVVKEDIAPFYHSASSTGNNNNSSNFSGNAWEPSFCPALHPMTSEASRRETFASWPHMNYKWALPTQMAEAGFYHQPNTPESDRAVCFLCNVCLICWEPSDEPWSEHERHAATCPLVKGDYTSNVPVAVSMATQPAMQQDSNPSETIACISTTTCPDLVATSTAGGLVVLWNISGTLKREISFNAAQRSQLQCPIRVTSLSVVSGSFSNGHQPVRCSLVLGVTLGHQLEPFLVVYDVTWTRAYQDVQPEPGPSTPTSNSSGSTIKKGGTTKKVLSTPHSLNANNSGLGSAGANADASANPGLFFSFGDDDEEMYISSTMDANEKLGKATGLLNKLMHNMGSPFTNSVIPQLMMGEKSSSSHSYSGSAATAAPPFVLSPKASDQPEVTLNQPTLINLKDCGVEDGLEVVSLIPTWDAGYLVAVLGPAEKSEMPRNIEEIATEQTKAGSHILLFQLNIGEPGLVERPVCQLSMAAIDEPRCVVMLPFGERNDDPEWSAEEEAAMRGPMRAVVVTKDGRLRLLYMDPKRPNPQLTWLDLESVTPHKFMDATYCSSVERVCATTDKGDLVFFKIITHVGASSSSRLHPSGRSGMRKGKEPSPTKLLIHQPLTSETLQSLYELTLAEKLPQACQLTITAASCWMEMAVSQGQRRQPQPWLLQPGSCTTPNNSGSEDGLQMARLFKLQQDKFSWDEHFFEMSLPPGVPVSHVHLRFVLAPSCSVPPEIQVSLLEQRSRSLQWGRTSLTANPAEEVDNLINFNMGQPLPRFTSSNSESAINPILTQEYLEAHNAVLLCGPFKLNQFLDASGQVAMLSLSSHQLMQSTAKNFLVHLKYIPSVAHPNSLSLLNIPRPMTNPCGRRTIQTKGCDWIQEVAISVQRFKSTSINNERAHRCALLASSNFTGQLLEFAFRSNLRREHIMALWILNWKTAAHYGAPSGVACLTTGDVSGHVVEIFNNLKGLLDRFVIHGNRTTAQQVVQLLFSSHELGICLSEEEVTVITKQMMHCLLQQLGSLQNCASPSVVHWYLVLLSRVYLRSQTEVAGPVWAVLTQIISELHRRREPLQQLLQSRYGFYGRPFETELMFSLSEDQHFQQVSSTKTIRNNIAANFAALNQLVNPPSPCDKEKSYNNLDTLSLKRSCDLLDVEPLPFTLVSASDGVRLEKADTGSSQFTAVALNGLVEASKLVSHKDTHATSHRWQHLLAINPPLVIVMERLHSGGRKFVILDFGAPILLTDVYIPACPDWVSITVDIWNRTDRSKSDTDLVRLAISSDINRRPVILHDLQPSVICRFLRLTITGRQGLSATSCKTSIGSFYGHSLILPNDLIVPAMHAEDIPVLGREEILENIATLEVLADHSQCHYNLAGDRLRSLLRPLLTNWHKDASGSSTHHIDHYLQSQVNPGQTGNLDEDAKIVEAYEECLKLQRQQNLLWSALRRLRRCLREMEKKELGESRSEDESVSISQTSSHKLHYIAQSLVNVLLASTALKKQIKIERKTAEQLFQHLYVTSCPASQLSTAALLSQSDDTYRWMPNFLADMLRKTLSSDPSTSLIPKDRVFVTLLFMGFKAIQLSSGNHLLDPVLAVLNEQLSVLENRNNSSPFALSHLDLPFVNWLLLFCCCCLDRTASASTKETKARDQRWDFMQGESLLSRDGANAGEPKNAGGSAASRIYRRKLQKKLMQQPHYGVSWPSGGVLSGSNKAKFILAHSKQKGGGFPMDSGVQMRRAAMMDEEMDSNGTDDKEGGNGNRSMPSSCGQAICSSSGAAQVAKNLISFLLVIGASGAHEETFLLTCKVLARLIGASQNGLRLGHIADEQQLTTLLRMAASASGQPSQMWLNHAIYCLLIDYLRASSTNKSNSIASGESAGASKSCSVNSVFTHGASGSRYDDILRSVCSEPEAGSSGSNGASSGPSSHVNSSLSHMLPLKPKMKMGQVSKKLPPMTVPPELLAYEQAKLAAESLKVDQHVDDLLELFENPNSESVPPVLKKAWPSISSVMKNLAECKSGLSASGYGSTAGILSTEEATTSEVWDLRDESRSDGPWKHKSDILSDAFFEAILQGLTSSFHDNKRRPLPEEIPGDPISAPTQPDQRLLSSAFNNLFSSASYLKTKTDIIASLKLWVLLNSENYGSSLESDAAGASSAIPNSSGDSSAILLNPEAIRGVLEVLAKIPILDVGDWTAVLRSLTWLSSPRWLLTETDQPQQSMENESSQSEELADQMCAGTVIRSPHLTAILYNFISGQGLVPYSLGDKQLVGPSIISTLGDVLSCLKVWCNTALVGSVLGSQLRSSLFELFLELAVPPRGPIFRGIGPLDAQICFVEALLKLGVQGLDKSLSIRVIQAVVSLSQMFLSRSRGLSCIDSSSQLSEDDRICFSGMLTASAIGGPLGSGSNGNNNGRASAISPSVLLTLSLQLAIRLVSNAEYGPSLNLADNVLSTRSLMHELLDAANYCQASSFASSLGATALGDFDVAFSNLHTVADFTLELLHQIAIKTSDVKLLFYRLIEYIKPDVATPLLPSQGCSDLSEPLLIFMLYVLKTKENVDIFHQVEGFKEVCLALSRTPVQLFNSHNRLVSNVLSYVSQTTATSGQGANRTRLSSRQARSGGVSIFPGGTTANAGILPNSYVDATSSLGPLAVFRRSCLRLDDDDEYGLLNLAPLSTISCSHPSAQPADVLLQPNPPHRRARSPSWSHHFYPAEQYIELTITLPCPVLVKEIQLHPHLTSLATCPSAVGVEMSPEGSGQFYPVGAVLSATGLTTIAFKLESPQVAALVLLRLYKPRDSSNIGLAQIRILGSLALPSSEQSLGPGSMAGQHQPGLTWLCILHHCLSVAEKSENTDLMYSLRQTAGSLEHPGMVERCCGLLNAHFTSPRAGILADVVQMASDILLHLGRHSSALAHQFIRLQLKESPRLLLGCTPPVANVLYELCSAENESIATFATPPGGSGQALLFQWLHRAADQGSLSQAVSTSMVHCAAAVLWHSPCAMEKIINYDFAKSLFDWTRTIHSSELKIAVDFALCSVCRHYPDIFTSLLSSVTSAGSSSSTSLNSVLQSKSLMETLGRAAQSESALNKLVQSGLLNYVSMTITEYCHCLLKRQEVIPADLIERVAVAFEFWTLLCEEWGSGASRDVLAAYLADKSLLQMLLQALCNSSSGDCQANRLQTSRIEDAAVAFFRQFCWAHRDNSRRFAEILLGVLQPVGSSCKLLTGFTRRLLLQLLLESEKIYVYVTSASGQCGLPVSAGSLSSATIAEPRHPAFNHGKKHKLLYVSAEFTCGDFTKLLTDYLIVPMPVLNCQDIKTALNLTSKRPTVDRLSSSDADKKAKQSTVDAEDQQRVALSQMLQNQHYLDLVDHPNVPLPDSWTLSQALSYQRQQNPSSRGPLCIRLNMGLDSFQSTPSTTTSIDQHIQPLTTLLEEFADLGGLAVLSQHLPMLLCASTSTTSSVAFESVTLSLKGGNSSGAQMSSQPSMTNPGPSHLSSNVNGVTSETIDSWVKLDGGSDDMDEEMDEILMPSGYFPPPTPQYMNAKQSKNASQSLPTTCALPLHSLAAFSLFLSMPLYTEAVLQDRRRAQMLLRLALGVSDDGQGGNILNSSDAALFPVLPFVLLQQVLDKHPLDSEKGAVIRQQAVDMGVLQLLLACLAVFTQQVTSANVAIPSLNVQFVVGTPNGCSSSAPVKNDSANNDANPSAATQAGSAVTSQSQLQQQQYWAKGTGFGTGSTAQTWDLDGAMQRQRQQEEQATCLLHTLAAYVHPSCTPAAVTQPGCSRSQILPAELLNIVLSSHLVAAICSYLRNDSVMDMARHVPLYKAVLLLLRSIAACPKLVPLLLPSSLGNNKGSSSTNGSSQSIHALLRKLKNYVSSYTARLASVQNRTTSTQEDSDSEEGIADLSKDICETWSIVKGVVLDHSGGDEIDGQDSKSSDQSKSSIGRVFLSTELIQSRSPEKLYCDVMQPSQFESYELLVESPDTVMGSRFTVAYHFENAVKAAGERCHPNRMKRLAQEVATLTTSLPLSLSSSVFVRCDTDRLDIMKVLITGPSDTPYGNGCFEFDVYFPPDYPQSPMQVHLATTGRHTVRFNPNLYNDGKVCLSVLNTWHGRPEEKWNPHTSSLLQVLVSIQSLILVSEPYFNEPGYERSRGTPSGNQNSRDYDVNIRQATVKWAMLEQIRNPAACFKQVTHAHFWLKRQEIEKQCEEWIAEMEKQVESDPNGARAVAAGLTALKRHYGQLKEELARLSPPPCLASVLQPEVPMEEDEEEKPLKTSPLPSEEFAIAYEEEGEEEDEDDEDGDEEVEDDDEDDISSQLLNAGKEEEAEGEVGNDLDELKEIMFSNTDSDVPLSWKEDLEDSETDMDNFVSQFTI
ncbi:hypothetical protein GHT06_016453 [Daphnia sinensis]|uniref:UBC core domain-containing protein n=1 Tax=Daphnia sinensis TaxID=1820382 RepID=A0AAD5PSZ9_9CRUS|nr:hypothetical protein GHT06_016453 [Daphnia sinensis]